MKPQVNAALGRFLAVRERSREEIRVYLRRKKVEEEEIETLLQRWDEVGLVSDGRFISTLVRSYLNKGKGPLFIRMKLVQAGIGKDQIEATLKDIPWPDLCQGMTKRLKKEERKWAKLEVKEQRLYQYKILITSGFLRSQVSRFIDDWVFRE